MDTRPHMEVAQKAWWDSLPANGNSTAFIVAALESAGLLREPGSDYCTRAERELVEAIVENEREEGGGGWWGGQNDYGWSAEWERVRAAARALRAERASAPATAPERVQFAASPPGPWKGGDVVEYTLTRRIPLPDEVQQYIDKQAARIAELESALAEERAKPKEAKRRVWFQVEAGPGERWFVYEMHEGRRAGDGEGFHALRASMDAPDAERHAREHAAKLTAEQGGGQ